MWLLAASIALPANAQQYRLRGYDEDSGLLNLAARVLLQDYRGRLWVGTDFGLYHYDGFRFELVTLPESVLHVEVYALAEDGAHRLWLAGPQGLWVHADGTAPTAWQPVTDSGRAILVPEGPSLVPLDGDTMAVATSDGRLLRVAPPSGPPPVSLLPPSAAGEGWIGAPLVHGSELWFGCGRQLCRLKNGQLEHWGTDRGVPEGRWVTLRFDRDGTLWARSADRAIVRSSAADAFIDRSPSGAPTSIWGTNVGLIEDPAGGMVTRTEEGLARWRDGQWTVFGSQQGLPATARRSLLFDQQGSLWIGTSGQGVFRWLGWNSLRHWTSAEGLPHPVAWAMQEEDGQGVWIATGRGVTLLDRARGHAEPMAAPAGLAHGRVAGLARGYDGALWFVERGQLMRIAAGSREAQTVRKVAGEAVFDDGQGRLWLLNQEGLEPLPDGGPPGSVLTPAAPGARRLVRGGDGRLLAFAIEGEGLVWSLDGDRWQALQWRGAPAPKGNLYAVAVTADHDLWLGGSFGLQHWRYDGAIAHHEEDIGAQVLGSRNVLFVGFDRAGRLWVGTDAGVAVRDAAAGRWCRLNRGNGLLWNDMMGEGFMAGADGSAWLASSAGITEVYDADRLFFPAPQLQIASARFGGRELPLDGAPPRLPWARDAALEVRLATPSFLEAANLRLRQRLTGVDDTWTDAESPRLRWSNLRPGSYMLEVEAVADRGSGLASPRQQLTVVIAPPGWLTAPAIALYVAALLLMLYGLFRWRLRVALQAQRRLDEAVAQRTEFIERDRRDLLERARRDALTGALNRGAIMEQLNSAIAAAQVDDKALAIVLADIDHFKSINDRHGHLVGDAVLRGVTARLLEAVRSEDAVGRYGGEEFLIVMPGLPRSTPSRRIEHLCRHLAQQPYIADRMPLAASLSLGVAWWQTGDSAETFVARADQALYRAKHEGRSRVCYEADPMAA